MYTGKQGDMPTADRVRDNAQDVALHQALRQVPEAEPARPAMYIHSVGSIQTTGRELRRLNNALYQIELHLRASINYREIRTARDQSQKEK